MCTHLPADSSGALTADLTHDLHDINHLVDAEVAIAEQGHDPLRRSVDMISDSTREMMMEEAGRTPTHHLEHCMHALCVIVGRFPSSQLGLCRFRRCGSTAELSVVVVLIKTHRIVSLHLALNGMAMKHACCSLKHRHQYGLSQLAHAGIELTDECRDHVTLFACGQLDAVKLGWEETLTCAIERVGGNGSRTESISGEGGCGEGGTVGDGCTWGAQHQSVREVGGQKVSDDGYLLGRRASRRHQRARAR